MELRDDMAGTVRVLPGQETLLASWNALTRVSPGARLIRSPTSVAAVFSEWLPLNNAIGLAARNGATATAAASQLTGIYGDAGVGTWALWVPRAR